MVSRQVRAFALLTAVVWACNGADSTPNLRHPGANLLILSIDTLRADRLGCYGYDRGLTPNLDALAAESVLFAQAYANSPKTASSHMSLFTSMLPTAHGVTNFSARMGIEARSVAANRLTIGQVLRRAGYWNAAVASGGNLHPKLGFRKGFAGRFSSRLRDVTAMVDEALQVLDMAARQDSPSFVFLHTYQVHGPYVPPEAYMRKFAPYRPGLVGDYVQRLSQLGFLKQWSAMHELWSRKDDLGPEDAAYLSDLYDAEIAYTDTVLGGLFDGLRERDLLANTIVVVLSDHGEEFAEHGGYEHDQLFEEHLHVPLMIRLPGAVRAGTVVRGLTSLLDVMPTLLDMMEIEGPDGQMMGSSLVPAILSGRTANRPIVAERVMFADDYQATLRSDANSVIFHAREGALQAYDRKEDPAEQHDVAWRAPWFGTVTQGLGQALQGVFTLRHQLDAAASGDPLTLSEQEMEELARLGYTGREAAVPEGTPLSSWPAGDLEAWARDDARR